ncbi:hypothetical protein ACFO7V_01650 [Glutamicibacter bergerei]|uniref:Uncharacterized protein n=1 Tax=Glutamicibacter bergerei TaxID=256702 RepID=A0ABV9MG67_9MICC|nr:hypothetical protein [Micrococcaceae bacterium]
MNCRASEGLKEKYAKYVNEQLVAVREPPMTEPFEHLLAKVEFESSNFKQIVTVLTILLTFIAITIATASASGTYLGKELLITYAGMITVLLVVAIIFTHPSVAAKKSAIAVYRHRHP